MTLQAATMKFQVITLTTIIATAFAIPSVELNSRTSPSEVTCAQNTGIAACCKDNQKQKATSPAVLDILGGILGGIPILSGLLLPVTAQVGVAQQCKQFTSPYLSAVLGFLEWQA